MARVQPKAKPASDATPDDEFQQFAKGTRGSQEGIDGLEQSPIDPTSNTIILPKYETEPSLLEHRAFALFAASLTGRNVFDMSDENVALTMQASFDLAQRFKDYCLKRDILS